MGSFSVILGPVLYLIAHVRGTQLEAARVSQFLDKLRQSPGYSEDTKHNPPANTGGEQAEMQGEEKT